MKISNLKQTHTITNFKSYNKNNSKTGLPTSTAFYIDYPVLKKSAEIIQKTFPQGTNILVYAGSNGEEALSLNTILNNKNKYNINSIDTCKKAIEYAKNGIYAIHPGMSDGFLIKNNLNKTQKEMYRKFHKHFKEIPKPKEQIDNVTDVIYCLKFNDEDIFAQKYFIPNNHTKSNIYFVKDDINNIEKFTAKNNDGKVGAVFFRNAFYQVIKNDLTGIIQYGDEPNLKLNKLQVLDELINNKIYKKLDIGGILVLGNHLQEHLFIADDSIPVEESILFDPTRNLRYSKKHLLFEVLNKNGNFKPIYKSTVNGLNKENNYRLPLIWQKIK